MNRPFCHRSNPPASKVLASGNEPDDRSPVDWRCTRCFICYSASSGRWNAAVYTVTPFGPRPIDPVLLPRFHYHPHPASNNTGYSQQTPRSAIDPPFVISATISFATRANFLRPAPNPFFLPCEASSAPRVSTRPSSLDQCPSPSFIGNMVLDAIFCRDGPYFFGTRRSSSTLVP